MSTMTDQLRVIVLANKSKARVPEELDELLPWLSQRAKVVAVPDITMTADEFIEEGQWQEQLTGQLAVTQNGTLTSTVPAHGVRVFVRNQPISNVAFTRALLDQMDRQ